MSSARLQDAFEEELPPPSRRAVVVKRGLSLGSRAALLSAALIVLGSLFQVTRARNAQRLALREEHAEPAPEADERILRQREEPEAPITVDPDQGNRGERVLTPESRETEPVSICPDDMRLVEGEYCPSVAHSCKRYISVSRDRCAEYRETSRCFGEVVPMRFCMDRFEYPNLEGVLPVLALTWLEAATLCKLAEKRLCTDSEWTLACEGPGRLPYPYGYVRNDRACNIDRKYIEPDPFAFADPKRRAEEIARTDQREPSGMREGCVSPFGVQDMTGNVDEWVRNESGFQDKAPYVSGLKGGYWGPVRNRCRPMTSDHNPWHEGYQIGFRCCADAQGDLVERKVLLPSEDTPLPSFGQGGVSSHAH